MRAIALAAVIGAGMVMAGAAHAQQFNDPNGRITFTAPSGWTVERQNSSTATAALLFNASNDCYVFGTPNAVTATASPENVVRSTTAPIAADAWTRTANSVRDFFPGNSAQLTNQHVDTSGFWPVQRSLFVREHSPHAPEGWQAGPATGAEQREMETLGLLACSLPDA